MATVILLGSHFHPPRIHTQKTMRMYYKNMRIAILAALPVSKGKERISNHYTEFKTIPISQNNIKLRAKIKKK